MKDLAAINELVSSIPKDAVITTHANPDADALGSSLGLSMYLQKKGHSVTVIVPNEYPDFLKWMPQNESVLTYTKEDAETVRKVVEKAEVIFSVDYSELGRIKEVGTYVRESSALKVVIDHHLNPSDFGDYYFHSTEAAAAAQLVHELILACGDGDLIDHQMASCLYAGIMTDTGSFKHSNTTAEVHTAVADLIHRGADPGAISRAVYDNNSLHRMKFLGYALSDLLEVDLDHGVGLFAISMADAERFQLEKGDTEGLVNYALSIRGMRVAALFKESDGEIKMSFRSVGDIAVNKFAENYFNGGGHKNAAGGASEESLEKTVEKFKKLVNEDVLTKL